MLTALFGAGLGSAAGMLTANRRTDDRLSLESARARSFDPEGGDGEHEEQLALLLDRKPATAWSTEHYPLRTFSATKTGVGVVIQLAKMAKIDQVVIAPSNRGWSGQVFVDVAPHAELAQWGVASGQFDSIAGNTRVSIRPKLGQFVLVWITDLGPDRQARIAEISVKGT